MILKILYDNSVNEPLIPGWGFSCYLEIKDNKIIFDTGWNGDILLHNMELMNVQPDEIDKIVLSHGHWDHIGGLNHLLSYKTVPDLYLPQSLSINLKNEIKRHANVVEISYPQKISENIWTTGELGEKIKEQALVIETSKGNVILTGCAHPGLNRIIESAKNWGDVRAVVGGFHDSNIDVLADIAMVIPCHCTEKVEDIKKGISKVYKKCKIGYEFRF